MAKATPQAGIPIIPVPGVPGIPTIPVPGLPNIPGVTGNGPSVLDPFHNIGNALKGASEAEHLFAKLLDPHTYVRMGEVTVGVILLAAGLFAALNGKQKVDSASRTIIRTSSVVNPGARAASSAGKVSYAREAGKINARKAAKSTPPLTKK